MASTTAASVASGSAIRLVKRALLARRIAGGAADDLNDLRQAAAISNGQRMLAPNPVEPFLGHPQSDNDINVITVVACAGSLRDVSTLERLTASPSSTRSATFMMRPPVCRHSIK